MLHSAANNAYSWWWASHLRKKQSKWLEQNLQEVEEKVQSMLKIIEQDGDSFAKRAEMYYKERPELIDFVEESYRAHRALAERYDLLSRELQTANHTLATVAPDQQIQQLSLIESTDDDDDDATSMSMSGCTFAPSPSVFEESFEANSLVPAALSAVNNIIARENNISKTEEVQLEKEGGEDDDQLQVKACNIDDDALPLPEVNNDTKEEEEEDKGTQSTGDNISTLLDIDYIVQEDELDEKNTRFQEEDGLNWRLLYLNNTDQDRERPIMVEEYANILQEYKDVKMKLNQVERKNCDNIFELASHVRELRIITAAKDEEITMLRNELAALRSDLSHKNDQLNAADTKSLFHHMLDQHNYNKDLENMSLTSVLGTREFTRDTNTCGAGAGASSRPNLTKAESRLRAKLDDLFEANHGFWLRFSTSFNKIHKFQTSITHLQEQSSKLREAKKQDTDHDKKDLKSDAKLLYKHLRETQTNLTLWLEHNAIFEQELKTRFLSLNNIEEEITVNKASNSHTNLVKNDGGEMELISDYHAAKFQGEVLNMKQENNKVFEELHAGIYRVNVLMMEVDGELSRLDKEFGSLLLKYKHPRFKNSLRKPGIPLQSFLFGPKSKKQRKQSIFGWMT